MRGQLNAMSLAIERAMNQNSILKSQHLEARLNFVFVISEVRLEIVPYENWRVWYRLRKMSANGCGQLPKQRNWVYSEREPILQDIDLRVQERS
jgi:hypothetical protein